MPLKYAEGFSWSGLGQALTKYRAAFLLVPLAALQGDQSPHALHREGVQQCVPLTGDSPA